MDCATSVNFLHFAYVSVESVEVTVAICLLFPIFSRARGEFSRDAGTLSSTVEGSIQVPAWVEEILPMSIFWRLA